MKSFNSFQWFCIAYLICMYPLSGMAQAQREIRGKITDADSGESLAGVTVKAQLANGSTSTDVNGNYSIAMQPGDTLTVAFLGYVTQTVAVGTQSTINIALATDVSELGEVVVIGYGTQRKGDVTSAIASLKEADFTKGAMRDASELIRGKVAGLNITNGSGDPAATPNINLRGISSLQGNTAPLVLINGIPGEFNTVAPQEIESIDVLKDASAAAIYGTRGANGVILITTKQVDRDIPTTLDYSTYFSQTDFYKRADFVDAGQLRGLIQQGLLPESYDEGHTTDWLSEITRKGFIQNHNLNIKGGNSRSNYVGNFNYLGNDGVFVRSYNNELRLSFDVNHSMFDNRLKLNANILRGSRTGSALGDGEPFNQEIYRQALIRNPTERVIDDQGKWYETSLRESTNPVAMIQETDGIITNDWTRVTANATVSILDGWDAKLMLATDRRTRLEGYSETKQHASNTKNGLNGYASRGDGKSTTDYLEMTSTYSKTMDRHRLNALAGYSYQYHVNSGGFYTNSDFPTDKYSYHNMTTGAALLEGRATMGSNKDDDRLIGFFGRVSYGFDNRYNILASVRREGSSKFGVNNKWGTFPSLSLGWTISNEQFMQDIGFLTNLKLRGGYGVTGVIPNDSYLSQTLLTYEGNFYTNNQWIQGLVPVSNPNPDLRWEKSNEVNIGLDFSLFANRLSGSIDAYNKLTKDMLWDYTVPVPPYLYNRIKANVGEMQNQGIEVLLNATPVKKANFEWSASFTFSRNKNQLNSLSNDLFEVVGDYFNTGATAAPIQTYTHRLQVGKSVGNFFGLKAVDIDENGEWVIETADGTRKKISEATSDDDKQYLGNGIPAMSGGLTNTFRHKNIDLSVVITGEFDFQILNFQRMFYENPTIQYNMLNSAFDKVYGKATLNYPQAYVSHYIEDGDYLKVQNITIGYNLPTKTIKFLNSARIYAAGTNLFVFTDYKGLDPEIERRNQLTAGTDSRDKYPTYKTLTVGLNVTF
ncbi:SusC/RagA family TonB-linked outer membrane protein [Parapedobacter pyrenivorans]|nr:SusC/RagA family TonB-linked outer membrane protein [Parapedobacter pyrenivorans]